MLTVWYAAKNFSRLPCVEGASLAFMFHEQILELFEEACEVAERTVESFENEVADIRERARKAEVARHEGLAPLQWVVSLTDGNLSFDPSFPVEGSFQDLRTSEQRVLAIVALLRKFFADKPGDAAWMGSFRRSNRIGLGDESCC